MIKSVTYSGLESGSKLLVFGAVHGNEKCGTAGITRVIAEIESGKLEIVRGQVTFVPIANPRAYDQDKRFTERNLNRYLVPMEKPDCYEARLGNILCPLLEATDVLLDIHSYTVGGEPFIFVGPVHPQERTFAASLGPRTLLTGWADAYAATGRNVKSVDDEESTGTTEYARRFGAIAVTFECGQHTSAEAPHIAYEAIRNALRHLEMTAESVLTKPVIPTRLVTVTHVIYRDSEGAFSQSWKHLEPVVKDQVIARQADGTPLTAPTNGFIIMPRADCPVGEEWFFFGIEK
jgi:predicted deacylase